MCESINSEFRFFVNEYIIHDSLMLEFSLYLYIYNNNKKKKKELEFEE